MARSLYPDAGGHRQPRPALVECVITTAALEAHFWLEDRADDLQILRTFRNGYSRIRAIAERKLLAHPGARVELTPDDFGRH
ncbi:DUF1488 family protein [Paraburkholderia dipogonis]|uniref:DUF1488 family protein n=1 Tax=Paraburkholderia dipogonis TaxID=1211383 RepID=A0A4Y8MGA1_9BURK|nr:DUF1488 family protein [Paraburkholderia dipogonis]TFE36467.1 DUF1488 family protein [Paraburkholderia dipogonis]